MSITSRAATAGLLSAAASLCALALHVRRNMGAHGSSLRQSAAASPHADGAVFANREPGTPRPDLTLWRVARMLLRRRGPECEPPRSVAPERPVFPAEPSALAATWLGHAEVLLEVDGARVLVDPSHSPHTSPVPGFGPQRLFEPPATFAAIGPVDVVLVSHDHYDHLDRAAVTELARTTDAVFVVPLGVGAHLRAWGVTARRVRECDWGDAVEVAGLTLTCAECRHFSGRTFTRNTTQWAGWVIAGPRHRVYAAGDTGATAAHAVTGREHGPFDLTLMPVGAYADLWPDIHATPEQAVEAHRALGGQVLLPIHWATFVLGFHPWSEPAERALAAAREHDVVLTLPPPGRRLDLVDDGDVLPATPWW